MIWAAPPREPVCFCGSCIDRDYDYLRDLEMDEETEQDAERDERKEP